MRDINPKVKFNFKEMPRRTSTGKDADIEQLIDKLLSD
jgi:hypothetical protein